MAINRLHIAVIFSLILHLIFINLLNQKDSNYQLQSNLFANKISLNFSLSEKISEKITKNLDKVPIYDQKHIKKTNLSQKSQKITTNDSNKQKNIPNISNYQLTGEKITPNYPKRSIKLGQEGVIYLKILVSNQGLPEKIIFTQKSKYNLLNKAALEAVSQWKFQPVIINGQKSKMWVNVPIEFKIS